MSTIIKKMSLRTQVLSGYRRLLRASAQTFRGDKYAIQEARRTLRDTFELNRSINNPNEIQELIKGIEEAETMLLYHIVQGQEMNSTSSTSSNTTNPRYQVKLTDPQKKAMRKDEELQPLSPNTGTPPLVINSGNACQRPT